MPFDLSSWLAINPAFWSAIAATFSAVAAFLALRLGLLSLRLQSFNRKDSIRPELTIEEFRLHKHLFTEHSRPTIAAILFPLKNAGRGSAFNTRVRGKVIAGLREDESTNAMGRVRSVIPPGEDSPQENIIEFFWPFEEHSETFSLNVYLYYFDADGRLYETKYRFGVLKDRQSEDVKDKHFLDVYFRESREIPKNKVPDALKDTSRSSLRSYSSWAPYFEEAEKRLAAERAEAQKVAGENKVDETPPEPSEKQKT